MNLYEKIAEQIRYQIEQGVLKPGERISSVRQASLKHNVSINTILQAYLRLEKKGLIVSRPQSGYYVRSQANIPLAEPKVSSYLSHEAYDRQLRKLRGLFAQQLQQMLQAITKLGQLVAELS